MRAAISNRPGPGEGVLSPIVIQAVASPWLLSLEGHFVTSTTSAPPYYLLTTPSNQPVVFVSRGIIYIN